LKNAEIRTPANSVNQKSRLLSGVRVLEPHEWSSLTPSVAGSSPRPARTLSISIPLPATSYCQHGSKAAGANDNIRLDLKSQQGKQRFKELLSTADVLIDGHAPGAFERLGFDSDTLFNINPNLIRTGVSFAPEGPSGKAQGL